MSKIYEIKFSKSTPTEELEKRKEDLIIKEKSVLIARGIDLDKVDNSYFESVKDTVVDKRVNEKNIIKALFQTIAKNEKDLSVFNEMADNISQLDNCEDSIKISETDLKRARKIFGEMPTEFRGQCLNFTDLMKQLESPKIVE